MPSFEFKNWAVIALGGIPNKIHAGDMGSTAGSIEWSPCHRKRHPARAERVGAVTKPSG